MSYYGERAFRAVIIGGTLMVLFCLMWSYLCLLYSQPGESGVYHKIDIKAREVRMFDNQFRTDDAKIIARTKNSAGVLYSEETDYGVINADGASGRTVNVSMDVAGAKGSVYDYFDVEVTGGGYKRTLSAQKYTDNFSVVTTNVILQTGVPEINSFVAFDGNATFKGRIINGWTGRPATESEMLLIANATFEDYFIMSMPKEVVTESDWLAFCEESRLAAIAEEGGFYVLPAGWDIDERGVPYMNRSLWQLNATTKTFQVIPGVV